MFYVLLPRVSIVTLISMSVILCSHPVLLKAQEYTSWQEAYSAPFRQQEPVSVYDSEPAYYYSEMPPYYSEVPPYYDEISSSEAPQSNIPPVKVNDKQVKDSNEFAKKKENPQKPLSADAKEKKEENPNLVANENKKADAEKKKEEENPGPVVSENKKADTEKKKEEKPKEPAFLIPLSLGHCGDVTFKPGARVQVRYNYERKDNDFESIASDDLYEDSYNYVETLQRRYEHDIFIRRFRLKGSGKIFDLGLYGVELKIDNVGRYRFDPRAEVENAWMDFYLYRKMAFLRVGFYDLPFSRDALTSDSKLLFMDRTLIKEKLTELGLADNTIGVMLHGRPYCGRFEYAVGIFDNIKFDFFERNSRQLMPAGRFVVNFLDPQQPPEGYADYEESYIGKGRRLAVGVNAAYLGGAKDELVADKKFSLWAWGADLFFNYYRFTLQAEYDWYSERHKHGYGWYVQSAYLFYLCAELAVRYQELVPVDKTLKEQWASVGLNTYFRQHNLKIQTDYTYKRKKIWDKNDHVFEIQLQLDF